MGIDRVGGPTLERGAARAGVGGGRDRRRRLEDTRAGASASGTFAPIFAPAFVVDTLREIAGDAELVVDVTAALTSPRSGLRHVLLRRPDRGLRVGSVALLGVRDGASSAPRDPGVSEHETVPRRPVGRRAAQLSPGASRPAPTSRSACGARRRGGSSSATPRSAASVSGVATARAAGSSPRSRGRSPSAERGLPRAASSVPYWRAMATWYEALEVGVPGGDVFEDDHRGCSRARRSARRSTPVT